MQRKIPSVGENVLRYVMIWALVLPDLARGFTGHHSQPCIDMDRNSVGLGAQLANKLTCIGVFIPL